MQQHSMTASPPWLQMTRQLASDSREKQHVSADVEQLRAVRALPSIADAPHGLHHNDRQSVGLR